jgi:hypothetical protein
VLLRFFRINDPYRLLGILVILILISLMLFIDPVELMLDELKMFVLGETLNGGKSLYTGVLTNTPPLFAWFAGWFEMLFGRSIVAARVISLMLLFFQLSFFTIILITTRAHNENTYLPGLVFGVLSLFSFDTLSLSSELLASTVLLFAINNLFKEIEFHKQRDEIVLNLGLYIGISSLFVFSYILYLPGVIIMLGIFTRLTTRKTLLVIFGFMLPHAAIMLTYFMKGNFSVLLENYYLANLSWRDESSMSVTSVMVLSIVPVIFLILSFFTLNREARLTKYQSQLSQTMFLWIMLAVAEVAFSGSLKPHQLITCLPPLAYFISHYLLLIRRKMLAEVMIWVFIFTITACLYLTRYGQWDSVKYQSLFPDRSPYNYITDKRVLVLGSDWGLFEKNKMATGFYEWQLSNPVFSEVDYFENVVRIDKAFAEDTPEVIIDEENKMISVFKRIPTLQTLYSRQGDIYLRKLPGH